jgi:signal peptidase I
MSKTKSDKDAKKPAAEPSSKPADGGWRETVESIAMAVILALLFRGFVAEAFVIPTGSMAPTLQGRHKDVECPKCHKWYQTTASVERTQTGAPTGQHVTTTTCPICRYTQTLDLFGNPNDGSFSGDRIIVGKFAYDFAEPERWDVIVFKFPGRAVDNYIKRLVGLPNERLWIMGGNVYTCSLEEPNPDAALKIARKPPHKLDVMLQLVDDTGHIPKELTEVGWPSRWQTWPAEAAATSAWQTQDGGRAFVCKGDQTEETWLRYRHLVPTHADWQTIELNKQLPSGVGERPGQLITDFYAYNAEHDIPGATTTALQPGGFSADDYDPKQPGPGEPPSPESLGQHWVDDLAVECLAEVTGAQGELSLLLVRGGAKYVCRINVADGKATLALTDAAGQPGEFISDDGATKAANPTTQTSVKGPGRYRLRLSDCDHELLLWVNGSVVPFDGPTTFASDDMIVPAYSAADPGDMAPAGIGSRGAAVKLTQLKVYRDKYYIASTGTGNDYSRPLAPARIQEVFRNPNEWLASGLFADDNRRHEAFTLEKDQFMPLGDNSPQSYDARYWLFDTYNPHHYVERDLLIGKALLIYWPHTWNRPLPLLPNVSRMGPIR